MCISVLIEKHNIKTLRHNFHIPLPGQFEVSLSANMIHQLLCMMQSDISIASSLILHPKSINTTYHYVYTSYTHLSTSISRAQRVYASRKSSTSGPVQPAVFHTSSTWANSPNRQRSSLARCSEQASVSSAREYTRKFASNSAYNLLNRDGFRETHTRLAKVKIPSSCQITIVTLEFACCYLLFMFLFLIHQYPQLP